MSDSDDTDFLLLIPPDFFVLRSPPCVSPVNYFNSANEINLRSVLSHHAESLSFDSMENRSVTSSSLRAKSYQSSYSGNRNNELLPLTLFDLSAETPDRRSNLPNSWPPKNDDFIHNSIEKSKDDFLRSRISTPGTSPADFSKPDKFTNRTTEGAETEKFSLRQVDKVLSEMEKTRAEIKSKLLSNKNKIHEMKEYSSGNNADESRFKNKSTASQRRDALPTSGSMKSTEFQSKDQVDSRSSSDSNEQLNVIKKQLNVDTNLMSRDPKNMLHLSKIMSKDNDVETLQQKLEAEILKKKHCEEIIQELQLNLLEQQQNLNVALKIDAQKEEVIGQLRQAWTQLVEHWKELEHQRQELAHMLEQERVEARNAKTNLSQKIEHLENRLHEAVSLANGYREKSEQTEKSLNELKENTDNRTRQLEENLKKTEQYVKRLEEDKMEFVRQLEQTSTNLANEKQKCSSLELQIGELQRQESALISEKNELTQKYQEEKNTANRLKSEMVKLKLNYTRASGAELAATKEISNMKQEMTKIKNCLKEYYQKQLDSVLREKVDEFQKEIDKAQTIMHVELHKQEKLSEEKLQAEISRLKNRHKMELSEERRINQKHVNILKAELKESRRKLYEMNNRLKLDSTTKEELAKLIQSVLHNQRFDELNATSESRENIFKDSSLLNGNGKCNDDDRTAENDEDFSDLEFLRGQSMSVDIKKYVEMLLDQEPCNVENQMNFQNLLHDHKNESSEKKPCDNSRKKPPWK